MTVPLMVLAVGAVVAGFVGVPAALGGGNAIEHFLEPSFTASRRRRLDGGHAAEWAWSLAHVGERWPRGRSIGLMLFSVVIARSDRLARRFYWPEHRGWRTVSSPERSTTLAVVLRRRPLRRPYRGHDAAARALWTFDRKVVDGAVNGTGGFTVISAWLSGLFDRYVVDGLVNLVGLGRQPVIARVPPGADRSGAELRAADAGRRLRFVIICSPSSSCDSVGVRNRACSTGS